MLLPISFLFLGPFLFSVGRSALDSPIDFQLGPYYNGLIPRIFPNASTIDLSYGLTVAKRQAATCDAGYTKCDESINILAVCCPDAYDCCHASFFCTRKGGTCCLGSDGKVNGTCGPSSTCCPDGGCAAKDGGTCCDNGGACPKGTKCYESLLCTELGVSSSAVSSTTPGLSTATQTSHATTTSEVPSSTSSHLTSSNTTETLALTTSTSTRTSTSQSSSIGSLNSASGTTTTASSATPNLGVQQYGLSQAALIVFVALTGLLAVIL